MKTSESPLGSSRETSGKLGFLFLNASLDLRAARNRTLHSTPSAQLASPSGSSTWTWLRPSPSLDLSRCCTCARDGAVPPFSPLGAGLYASYNGPNTLGMPKAVSLQKGFWIQRHIQIQKHRCCVKERVPGWAPSFSSDIDKQPVRGPKKPTTGDPSFCVCGETIR